MKDSSQRALEFILFVYGSSLMGYSIYLNFNPETASVMEVVGYWFLGVTVFCLPYILFSEKEKLLNRFSVFLLPAKIFLVPAMNYLHELFFNEEKENFRRDYGK